MSNDGACHINRRSIHLSSRPPRLRPHRTPVNSVPARQRFHAHALRAGCSHSVHFLGREPCSRSFLWFRRRPDQRVVGLALGVGIPADALIPRGNQPLDPWSPVPAAFHCVHRSCRSGRCPSSEHDHAPIEPYVSWRQDNPPAVAGRGSRPTADRGYDAGSCWLKAESNDVALGSKSNPRSSRSASGAPCSRSMPASSHSTEIGPS